MARSSTKSVKKVGKTAPKTKKKNSINKPYQKVRKAKTGSTQWCRKEGSRREKHHRV